jgi:hypothetical protein
MMPGTGSKSGAAGVTPVLGTPAAGVGGVDPDHRRSLAAGGHADQPGPKPSRWESRYGATQSLLLFPRPSVSGRVARASGEVQIPSITISKASNSLAGQHSRGRYVIAARTRSITARRTQARGEHVDAERFYDRVT